MSETKMTHPSAQLKKDLEELFPLIAPELKLWEGQNLLITGGTGFFGKWLLEALRFSREYGHVRFGSIYVLTRNPEAFIRQFPHLQDFDFIQGDIRNFKFPPLKIQGLIHGATSASAQLNTQNPTEMYETIVEGTRQALMCAKGSPGCRFLMVSSGAVYGKKNWNDGPSREEDFNFSDKTKLDDAYADGKREAERLTVSADLSGTVTIARCFAFVGPYLPLKEHFAIGNFIANVLNGEEILIKGDGSPLRSYLYVSELVEALIQLIGKGRSKTAYNVGSKSPFSIEQVAQTVMQQGQVLGLNPVGIRILGQGRKPENPAAYLPSTDLISRTLGHPSRIDLGSAINRTLRYHLKLPGLMN